MNRMDKYADETPELKRRVDKYSGLYESNSSNDYDKFDVDSNVSVLKDNARSIDVDQIREMLDKKYRDNIPKRKSISVESTNVDAEVAYKNSDEKDYDLNVILDKAKQNRKVSYEEDRFNRIETSSSEKLIDEINRKYKPKEESEEAAELLNLINTITELELKNKNKDSNFEPDDNVDTPNLIAAQELAEKDDNEETFYTGKLAIKEKDYDDFKEIQDDINIMRETVLNELLPFVQVAHAMAQKYQIVITNPPYMSIANASAKVNDYVKKNYPDSKTDFFAVFIEKCAKMTHRLGYQVMITQQSFYFLSGLEALRKNIIMNDILINSVHLGLGAFGNDFGTVAFVFQKVMSCREYRGRYLYLGETKSVEEKEKLFLSQKCPQYYHSLYEFEKLPNCTYSYTVSSKTFEHFGKNCMSEQFMSGGRNKTHNDDKYLRLHWEVGNTSDKWIPYGKGGEFRKWYGNHYYVVNWSETARKFYASHGGLCNSKFWGHEGLTWSFVTSYKPSFRFKPKEMIYSSVSPTVFRKDFSRDFYMMGLLNSNVGLHFLRIISSTIGTNVGEVLNFPVVRNRVQEVTNLVEENLLLCKKDWDSFEVSPEFLRHPLLLGKTTLEAYSSWEEQCSERFEKLKKNERLLNEIFIDTYGLQGEVNAEVEERDVEASCRHAELHRDVKSFISYAVGCMFGRYSLDVDGPVYAGGQWDGGKYASFPVDADNIIPICDDEYFPDDIVGRFVKFIETVYGKDTLEENLKFIADVLGSKGMPRNVIRNYFLNNFYADHCKMYQKRPIYWLFDSGKKNGFKALIYMHRYQPDTLARMRTDYVHEQQERYRTAITHLEERISNSPTSERVKLNKQLGKLKDQATEIRVYEEEIHHLADQMIHIDLDDGVKKNYEIFKDVLAKIK